MLPTMRIIHILCRNERITLILRDILNGGWSAALPVSLFEWGNMVNSEMDFVWYEDDRNGDYYVVLFTYMVADAGFATGRPERFANLDGLLFFRKVSV